MKFEKLGVPAEQIKFDNECTYHGFSPNDYLRLFVCDGIEYEFYGFQPRASKYKCLARNVETGSVMRFTDSYMHKLLNQVDTYSSNSYNAYDEDNSVSQTEDSKGNEELRLLSEKECSILQIKLQKSKRNERDWEEIVELFQNKAVFSFNPPQNALWLNRVDNFATEHDIIVVFTEKKKAEKHIEELMSIGLINADTTINVMSFEHMVSTANRSKRDIIVDPETVPQGKHYGYHPGQERFSVDTWYLKPNGRDVGYEKIK